MATADPPDERDAAKTAIVAAAVLGAVFSIVALVGFGGRAAGSVVVGAVIAVANLVMLRAIIRAILKAPEDDERDESGEKPAPPTHEESKAEGRRGGAAWGIFAVLKIIVLFGGVGLLLTKRLVDPMPLVVGYGVLPLGIVASALVDSLSPKKRRRSKR